MKNEDLKTDWTDELFVFYLLEHLKHNVSIKLSLFYTNKDERRFILKN